MLKTIKKALWLSSFVYLFALPIRQVAQAALKNIASKEQFISATLAKMWIQKATFYNSPTQRCPIITSALLLQAAEDGIKDEVSKNESTDIATDESVTVNHQDATTNYRVYPGLKQGQTLNQNTPWCIDLRPKQVGLTNDWQSQSSTDMAHKYDAIERQKHLSEIAFRNKLEQLAEADFLKVKSETAFYFSDFQAIVQDKVSNFVNYSCSSSRQEIATKKAVLLQRLCVLENKLLEFTQQNPQFSFISDATRYGFQDGAVPYHSKEKWTHEDYHKALAALELKAEIEAIKGAIQECDWKIDQFAQEKRDFVNKLKNASVDTIEKNIITNLIEKKGLVDALVVQSENELNQYNEQLKIIDIQLKIFHKRSLWAKFKSVFKSDYTEDILLSNQKSIQAEQQKTNRKLQSLYDEQKKYNGQIEQAQKVVSEKKLQEAQLLEKQEQERLTFYQEMLQDQHDRCDFSNSSYPDNELENQWSQRQEALAKTIEQGYVQYDKKYTLTQQAEAFLATCGIDAKEFQTFFGTTLQQQLHGEMCDIFSQAAIMQVQFPYQKNLLTSVVNFADAAHDANKNNQILLASQLLDVDCYLLKLNHQIIDAVTPYAQASMYEMVHSVTDIAYMAAHPAETIKGLSKALYYVLETVVLNDPELVIEYPEIYEPMRDARNLEIVAGLRHLGDQIANSTGPERFGALVRFGSDFVIPGKIIHAVGEVCGFVKTQAKVMRTLEGVARMVEEQGLTQELIQATEKFKVAMQENIAKNLVKELTNAEKSCIKSVKSLMHGSSEPIRTNKFGIIQERSFVEKKLSALEKAQKNAERIRKFSDGRIRYYTKEDLSKTVGQTRGRSHVTEFDLNTNQVRQWEECYDHAGNVNRVHIKMIDGKSIETFHNPLTKKDLEIIEELIKGKK